MEEWHQKLHNNTSPDDVVICQVTNSPFLLVVTASTQHGFKPQILYSLCVYLNAPDESSDGVICQVMHLLTNLAYLLLYLYSVMIFQ
jgi:hypothetical protein